MKTSSSPPPPPEGAPPAKGNEPAELRARFAQARVESQAVHKEFASVREENRKMLTRLGAANEQFNQTLRRAALNLLEDAEIARQREVRETANREFAEAAQRASEERLQLALAAAEMGTFAWYPVMDRSDSDGRVTELYGLWPGDELNCARMGELMPPEHRARHLAAVERALDPGGGVLRSEHRITRPRDGVECWIAMFGRTQFAGEPPVAVSVTGVCFDITERKAAEAAVRESEQRLQTLADAVPQLIWTNTAEGTANYFNRRWYEYSGLTFEESEGPGWQVMVHPEDAPASTEQWQRALAAGEVFDCEYRLRAADGSYRWFIGRNVPERDTQGRVTGWFGTATDIHDLKEAQAAVREAEERMRLIVENAREYAIFSMALDRRITSWNSGAQAILGYTLEEALGQSGDIIFTSEDRAECAPETEAEGALAQGRAADERWHVRKDGSRFWGSGVMTAMHDAQGRAIGLLKIFRDHTEQRRAKEALEQSLAETQQARAEAESANRAKDHFMAVLSHELRTPLTPVLMSADFLLMMPDMPAAVRDGLEMIHRNVTLESQMIGELLDLTRIARGKVELDLAPLDLHEVIRLAVEVASPDIAAKSQSLTCELHAAQRGVVGDSKRLQQVFWNVLKNAAKFTPEQGVIVIRSANEPAAPEAPDRIIVEITDTGIGFDPEASERIFNAFTQASETITQKFGGLGLGLAISKATVDAHQGTLRATSAGPEQGATFTVCLPLAAA